MQQQPQQIVRRTADRRMFSSSDDSAMMKQIQSTHAPDGRVVDVKPTMLVIEEILRRASPGIDGVINVHITSFSSHLSPVQEYPLVRQQYQLLI